MYCARCGVKLADTEQRCPLCGTEAYHPDIERPEVAPLYPKDFVPKRELSKTTIHIIILTLFLIPILVTLYCDYYINRTITWSPYVAFSLIDIYIITIFPFWFKKPTPAVFVPIDFLSIALLLHYINYTAYSPVLSSKSLFFKKGKRRLWEKGEKYANTPFFSCNFSCISCSLSALVITLPFLKLCFR